MSENRVHVLGIAVLDFVFKTQELPDRATKYRADDTSVVLGGCAANAAVAIAALGGTVSLSARLGDDPVGDLIEGSIAALGIGTKTLHRQTGAKSSFSSIAIDAGGERQILNFRGTGLIGTADWIALPNGTTSVLADTRWPEGFAAAMRQARHHGIPGIADVDTPLDDCDFASASHLAFAREALHELTGLGDITTALKWASERFDAWVCATDGANGVYLLEGSELAHIPAPKVDAVDTLGAGDVWHGAFAHMLAKGSDEAAACRFANATAALKCTKFGVAKAVPERSTVLKFMEGASWN